jgi:hypothetical protein
MNKRNYVRLKVVSNKLTAEDIAKAIDIEPDLTWKIGDLRPKTTIKEKTNGWMVQSNLPKEASLELHIENLLGRLQPVAPKLFQLSIEAEVQLSCVAYDASPPALFFEKEVIAQISALGATLDIDLYITA